MNHFNPDRLEEIGQRCRSAGIGCVDCKKLLAQGINAALEPFRERRAVIAAKSGYVEEVIGDGAERASVIAQESIREVKEAMCLL